MRIARLFAVAVLASALPTSAAYADLGWTLEQYTQAYGHGERGYGKAPEVGFQIGDSRLVVELAGDRSVAELWLLGGARTKVPKKILEAGEEAFRGPLIQQEGFKARSSIAADIHEAVIDGVIVRTDVRNNLLSRVALCGRAPTCSWWRRLLGRCESNLPKTCGVLDRMLQVDHKMDDFQDKAEKAANRIW